MVKGPGEDEDIMSMDCPRVMVKWVGKAWVKWRLASRPYREERNEVDRVGRWDLDIIKYN